MDNCRKGIDNALFCCIINDIYSKSAWRILRFEMEILP